MTDARRIIGSFWFLAALLTVARIITLMLSPANLGPDESQYWFWSQTPAFGYFSKPPMIAWVIGITTTVFGNAEWAIRLAAPLLHFGTATFLYFSAAILFDKRVAFWTGLGWITLPGVILSSFLITTDAPLLFFWSGAIYALVRIIKTDNPTALHFAALGLMIGLGFLSKYAMIYFPVALAASLALTPALRRIMIRPALVLTIVIALALITPNIFWNAQNDFQTLSHTAANANWGVDLFQPLSLFAFLSSQFAVAGPMPVIVLLIVTTALFRQRGMKDTQDEKDAAMWRTLILLALIPIIIVSIQSFLSRAHANWAATAYPAAVMLATAFLFQHQKAWLARASLALHASLAGVFLIAMANFSSIDQLGLSRATKEISGWKDQTAAIAAVYDANPSTYDAIAIDDRSMMGAMLYYQRNREFKVVALNPNRGVDHHYEAFVAMDPTVHKRVLFVSTLNSDAHVNYRFRNVTPLGPHTVNIGSETRTYHLFDISGYYGDTL